MWRAIFVILVLATAVGALMPGGRGERAEENSSVAGVSVPSDWGSGEGEVTTSSTSSTTSGSSSSKGGGGSSSYGSTIRLSRRPDGHFYADAKVNGATVNFLIDTGASGIALTYNDARRARIDIDRGNFYVVGQGASGPVKGQVIRLDDVKLGGEHATNVQGIVMDGGEQSLLGQSFLERFGSVEIRGDTMTLR